MRAPILPLSLPGFVAAAALVACGGAASKGPMTTTTSPELGDGGVSSLDIDAGNPTTVAPLDGAATGGQKLPNIGATRGPEPGRGRDDILALVRTRKAQARACYDAALKDHPGIEGEVALTWTIDPQGNVSNVAVDNSNTQILEPAVTGCLSTIVMSFHFPESARGLETHASYPWTFHPRGTPGAGSATP